MPEIIMFAVPLMFSSILQLLFNAADVIVVGRFDPNGSTAVGAVGSTGALINLIINIFLGLSVGTNVIVARYYGSNEYKQVSEAVHTSVALSLVGGAALAAFGFMLSRTFLTWMSSPPEVLPLATLYMQIYFLGMPVNMLYNFGAAVLRAVGDTKRPLFFLGASGVINVILNLIFVIMFHMGVAGVALATIISQGVAAALVLICLLRSDSVIRVDVRKLRISIPKVIEMAKIGVPAGMQGACFSISNVIIQSTVNGFGKITVSGNSISSNVENFVYVAMNAVHQAAVTFMGQNAGAKQHRRIRQGCLRSILLVTVISLVLSTVVLLFQEQLFGIYTTDPAVIEMAKKRVIIFLPIYFTYGIADTLCGVLRGLGETVVPTVISLLGICASRMLWIYLVFPFNPTQTMLYISYPLSWVITAIVYVVYYLMVLKKFPLNETPLPARE